MNYGLKHYVEIIFRYLINLQSKISAFILESNTLLNLISAFELVHGCIESQRRRCIIISLVRENILQDDEQTEPMWQIHHIGFGQSAFNYFVDHVFGFQNWGNLKLKFTIKMLNSK